MNTIDKKQVEELLQQIDDNADRIKQYVESRRKTVENWRYDNTASLTFQRELFTARNKVEDAERAAAQL